MLKRILYGAGVAVLLTAVLWLFFFRKPDELVPATMMQAVAPDAVIFMDQIDFETFTSDFMVNSMLWNALTGEAAGKRADSVINRFVSQLSRAELLQDLLIKRQLGISLHLVGKEKLVPVFYLNYSGSFSEKEFRLIVEELLGSDAVIEERRFESAVFCDVKGSNPWVGVPFTFTQVRGLFIVSPVSVLVEEAVRTLQTGNGPEKDPGFRRVSSSAGRNVQGNLYISYRELASLLTPFTSASYRWKLSFPGVLADWGEADINLKTDALALTGMVSAADTLPRLLNIFSGQSSVKMSLPASIPSSAVSCLFIGVSDPARFGVELRKYLEGTGEGTLFSEENGKWKNDAGFSPFDELIALMDDEAAWLSTNDSDLGEQEVAVFETRSRSLTQEMLERWVEGVSSLSGSDRSDLVSEYRVDDQTVYTIYHFDEPFYTGDLTRKLFGKFFTVYDNLLLSGSSEQALTRTIYQNILHKTLANDPSFTDISNYFASRANVTFYFRPVPYLQMKAPMLSETASALKEENGSFLSGFSGLIVQYVNEGSLFYQNISAKYSAARDEQALTLWESRLDTVASIKPTLVINANTQEKEIFVQDAHNTIYLINSAGRILWRRALDGPVLGEVYQIDYYRNGKLQYLFNTPDRLHLIDRNGNNVEKFPVNLRSRATNPLGLFDYDNKGDYRIFLAGTDRRIYVYDKSGNIVPGWSFSGAEKVVENQVQHFRVKDKDYIVFSDAGRSYILDRQGHDRVLPEERVALSPRNQFYLDMNIRENKPRLVSTDTSGNVVGFGFDGKVSVILKHTATRQHYFRMQDMDQDGISDFLFADGNELSVFSGNGKKLYSYKVRGEIMFLPDVYRFSASDIKVGIAEGGQNRIYLISSDGSLYDGFPLAGDTRFSIGYFSGSESRFNLIVGSSDSFLYNYSIE